eukprot:1220333-Pleurochrysis_carterae.AAC.1
MSFEVTPNVSNYACTSACENTNHAPDNLSFSLSGTCPGASCNRRQNCTQTAYAKLIAVAAHIR